MENEVKKLAILVEHFNQLFLESENTRLKIGAKEPFYRAAREDRAAVIFSRDNYLSSALHEIAHWSIAGKARRELDDFGYWYQPEGRTVTQQKNFEQVEIKPQAIEWALSLACAHRFHFSADNLSQEIEPSTEFKESVYQQLKAFLIDDKLPLRAQLLFKRLNHIFRQDQPVKIPYV